MTDISDILLKEAVFVRLPEEGRKQILGFLSAALAAAAGIDKRELLSGIMARERLGSTAIGGGVAIPHAGPDGLLAPIGAFASLERPADFDAADGQKCDLIFMLLAPPASGSMHLRALARISLLLGQQALQQRLRRATDRNEMLEILTSARRAAA